jgi:hypothetical protein
MRAKCGRSVLVSIPIREAAASRGLRVPVAGAETAKAARIAESIALDALIHIGAIPEAAPPEPGERRPVETPDSVMPISMVGSAVVAVVVSVARAVTGAMLMAGVRGVTV